MKLIVGLGNPGRKYAKNRHNVGFQCVDALATVYALSFDKMQFKALTAQGEIEGVAVVLAKPLTFMNLSGQSVRSLMQWYKVCLEDLLVVYDDLDLPLGRLRMRAGGGAGGHKGMLSIIQALGTQEFPRLRVGIGRPVKGDPEIYVLRNFTRTQLKLMKPAYDEAVAAMVCFLREGITAAMNRFNATVVEDQTRG